MDGLLVIDKPAGPTSHDVVARVRRVLRERRVGHTGTLDPGATGVLPLVVGRATRLARFISAGDKTYEAVVRLGVATDTADADGTPTSTHTGPLPDRAAIERGLDAFRGTFLQQPPAYSAKKIGGRRSYALAREQALTPQAAPAVPLPPSLVTVHSADILAMDDDRVTLRIHCSAGFYVRALADDLGARLGVGGHLAALRRTRVSEYGLEAAIRLEHAERDPEDAARRIIPIARMLSSLPAAVLTLDGVRRALHGQDVRQGSDLNFGPGSDSPTPLVRLLDPAGELVAIAEPAGAGGLLHPSVVLV